MRKTPGDDTAGLPSISAGQTLRKVVGSESELFESSAGTPERRLHQRQHLKIPFSLHLEGIEYTGRSQDISPGGFRILSETHMKVGTPLSLQCSFADICHLDISGQVVAVSAQKPGAAASSAIGIKFVALRDWEDKILTSALQELRSSDKSQERSLLKILVSKDTLALESSEFYKRGPVTSAQAAVVVRKSCVHAAKITGWGAYLPSPTITNLDVNSLLQTPGKKKRYGDIVGTLTGIESRHYACSKLYPSDLAVEASHQALKNAGVAPKDLEVIISCGVARDCEEPATAYIIQDKLGAYNAYAFDLANACNGFVSAIDVLDSFIASGRCETGLIAVGEILSQYITWDPETESDLKMSSMSYTLGDGGGAVVVQRARETDYQGIRSRWFLSDGTYWKVAVVPLMDSEIRRFKSNAAAIERAALEYVPRGVEETLEMLNWSIEDVDLIIPHQVSWHIIKNLFFKRLGIPEEKVYWSFPKHGNVGAASMPVALCAALEEGRLKPGDKVLLVGGSGGFGVGVMGLIF